jgi:hypothetical protein
MRTSGRIGRQAVDQGGQPGAPEQGAKQRESGFDMGCGGERLPEADRDVDAEGLARSVYSPGDACGPEPDHIEQRHQPMGGLVVE